MMSGFYRTILTWVLLVLLGTAASLQAREARSTHPIPKINDPYEQNIDPQILNEFPELQHSQKHQGPLWFEPKYTTKEESEGTSREPSSFEDHGGSIEIFHFSPSSQSNE